MPSFASWKRKAQGRAAAFLIKSAFEGVATLGSLHPKSRLARHGVERLRDIPFADRREGSLRLDVYRPIGTQPGEKRPVVFYVHGGGFSILSKDTHWIMGLAFAKQGFVVVSIDYRLAPGYPFPHGLEDVCDGFLWALDHVAQYGGDPSRIVFAGESAGANLVTALTIMTCTRRDEAFAARVFERGVVPLAVLPACGIHQVTDTARFSQGPKPVTPFIQRRLDSIERAYFRGRNAAPSESQARELADVLTFFEKKPSLQRPLPPFLIQCGTADPILADSLALATAIRGIDGSVQEAYYPNEIHAFHALAWRKEARRAWVDAFAFLDQLGIKATRASGRKS